MSYRPLAVAAAVTALSVMHITSTAAQSVYVAPGGVYVAPGAGPVLRDAVSADKWSSRVRSARLWLWVRSSRVRRTRLRLWIRSSRVPGTQLRLWIRGSRERRTSLRLCIWSSRVPRTQLRLWIRSSIRSAQVRLWIRTGCATPALLQWSTISLCGCAAPMRTAHGRALSGWSCDPRLSQIQHAEPPGAS